MSYFISSLLLFVARATILAAPANEKPIQQL